MDEMSAREMTVCDGSAQENFRICRRSEERAY